MHRKEQIESDRRYHVWRVSNIERGFHTTKPDGTLSLKSQLTSPIIQSQSTIMNVVFDTTYSFSYTDSWYWSSIGISGTSKRMNRSMESQSSKLRACSTMKISFCFWMFDILPRKRPDILHMQQAMHNES